MIKTIQEEKGDFMILKSKKIIFLTIMFSIGLLIFLIIYNYNKPIKVGEFSISDYKEMMEEFGTNEYLESIDLLGEIKDEDVALKKAESVWVEWYGKEVEEKKPYIVSYDESASIWLVEGSLPRNMAGGVPYILIRKSDGKVLAIWHDK